MNDLDNGSGGRRGRNLRRAAWGAVTALVVAGGAGLLARGAGTAPTAQPEAARTVASRESGGTTTGTGGSNMPGVDHSSMPGMSGTGSSAPAGPPPIDSLPEAKVVGVTRMGNLVMPPGMIMTPDMPMEAMEDMAAVDLAMVRYTAPADARGDQVAPSRVQGKVRVFDLETSIIRWNILPDRQVAAYAVNNQVPGPRLELTVGERVRINVTNRLPEPTSIHWHGLVLPNAMDGAAGVTQPAIEPGDTFVYEFTVRQPGTYFYHSHSAPDRQQALGLYGALIVRAPGERPGSGAAVDHLIQLQEWTVKQGYTFPAMVMEGALPNYFTINGKAYPATETIRVKLGQTVRLRFVGSQNNFVHPLHVHGGPFTIVETDGNPVPEAARLQKDVINVGPGERYDVVWTARERGRWLIHCHIPHHTTNNNVEVEGGGGMTMIIDVT